MAPKLPLDELSGVFARIKGHLLTEDTVNHAVDLLARAAKDTIPETLGAGVTLVDALGRKTSTGATDSIVRRLDALQYETGQGPCLTAWAAKRTIRMDDTAKEDRWMRWTAAVSELPVRSTLSTPLVHHGTAIGALKIYSSIPSVFTEETERLLELFAGPAAALLANIQTDELPRRLSAELRTSLHSRDTISLAKGMLMERGGLDETGAMRRLLDTARSERSTLYRVALSTISDGPSATR